MIKMDFKKNVIVFCLLVISIGLFAQSKTDAAMISSIKKSSSVSVNYYVSNVGNDDWNGMSAEHIGGKTGPWKTLNKVNQQMAKLEGASVRFRRGDQFEGNLEVNQNNISFEAYGDGERPILSGAEYASGNWIPVAGRMNIYQYQVSSDVADVTMLLRENTSLPLGRTPNGNLWSDSAFYTFNNRIQTSIYDPELKDAENLVGSELVLRKTAWGYSNYPVTAIEGTTVNFLNDEPVPLKRGDGFRKGASYFFQKNLNTLDLDGEWFFDKSKHILYLYADVKPLPKSIQYSTKPIVVNVVNVEGIALQGLRIEMAGEMGIKVGSSKKIDVRDCEIVLCGNEGISIEASSARIDNNYINECLGTGIHTSGEGRVVITKNKLSNIGLIAGRGTGRYGMHILGGNSEMSYNRITNIGYIGIRHSGGNNLIRRNVIDTYNLVYHDGGAIYTNHDQTGTIIEENIIMNGMAHTVGTAKDSMPSGDDPFCSGIQCDLLTKGVIIRYNTITFPVIHKGRFSGIHFNFNSVDNLVLGNTILAKGAGISTNDRDPYERAPGEASPPSMSGNRFEENVIVRTSPSNPQLENMANTAFALKETEQCDVENQGLFLNNVCAVPFIGLKTIFELQYNCNVGRTPSESWFATAAEWNDAREYASGNLDAPIKVDPSCVPEGFIQLYTNDSDNAKTIPLTLGETFLDAWGKKVSGSVTIAPWRSVVLFKKL